MVRHESPEVLLSDADAEKLLKTCSSQTKLTDTSAEDTSRSLANSEFPSILELKKALPSHCFQPKLTTSYYYVAKDLLIIAALFAGMRVVETYSPWPLLTALLYLPYWYFQGTIMAAVFVLGHDCGHGSFSNSSLINDITGNILHSMILVPYYPWKISHNKHHKNTGNLDKDEIFYPVRERDFKKGDSRSIAPLFGLGMGWFIYAIKGYTPRRSNHLNPFDEMFAKHVLQCVISLVSMAIWTVVALVPYTMTFGVVSLVVHYLVPLFIFATWLVLITFLHHHDEQIPWFADHKWSFVKGQLSSVDRHYGIVHGALHHIGTHQIHHLFSKIPHYYVEEATRVFRRKYPHLVRINEASIYLEFWRMFWLFNAQQWIKNDTEVHYFDYKRK